MSSPLNFPTNNDCDPLTHSLEIFNKPENEKEEAAIKIQSIIRSHLAQCTLEKEKRRTLHYSLFEKAKELIDNKKTNGMASANAGKTTVRLPKDLPIVIKTLRHQWNSRLSHMNSARNICEKNNYTHLIIPEAKEYSHYIIERRLPINTHYDPKFFIGFYLENAEKFNDAVFEFAGLLCQGTLGDIIGNNEDPYGKLLACSTGLDLGRYDNAAPYVENGIGKIGLIDLEDFYSCGSDVSWDFVKAFRLFPLHYEIILESAKRFHPTLPSQKWQDGHKKDKDTVLAFFKTIYYDHKDFVIKKGIPFEHPEQMFSICQETKEKLKSIKIDFSSLCSKEDLNDGADQEIAQIRDAIPEILDLITALVTETLNNNIKKRVEEHGPITAYPELLTCRSIRINESTEQFKRIKELVLPHIKKACNCEYWKHDLLFYGVIRTIFEELVKENIIAYYTNGFGWQAGWKQLLYC